MKTLIVAVAVLSLVATGAAGQSLGEAAKKAAADRAAKAKDGTVAPPAKTVTVAAAAASAQQQVQPGAAATTVPEFVYIVTDDSATGLYHKKDCPWLRNHPMRGFAPEEAQKRYFQPHCLCTTGKDGTPPCDPPPAPPAAAMTPAAATTSAPPTTSSAPTTATAPVPIRPATPAAAPARQQCAATTQKGARCLRMAAAGSAYCWQHPTPRP